jgi:signal transduction histidine kinase
MVEGDTGYPLTAWRAELRRTRDNLEDALRIESRLASRPPEQQKYLSDSVAQFWRSTDQVLDIAEGGEEERARRMISNSLHAQQASLANIVARLLVENNESEEQAAAAIQSIYGEAERNIYLLLAAVLAGIVTSSLAVILTNRRLFNRVGELSEQRSTLARQLIEVQEGVLRSVSRELHDDFGQILTAVGALLGRAEKKGVPPDSPLRAELTEVRDIVGEALEKIRSLSQTLHPTVLEDYGLEQAIERLIPMFEKQTGIAIRYDKKGEGTVPDEAAIHVYRILQEALTNVARHSQAKEAAVRLHVGDAGLRLEVEDRGVGMNVDGRRGGLGLVAMRERAELLHGRISFERPGGRGTLVILEVPLNRA